MIPRFFLNELTDKFVRENFKKLSEWFRGDAIVLSQFKFFQVSASGSSQQTFSHNLGFIPKDLLLLNISAGQTVTFAYDSFTTTTITFTPSGTCTLRLLLGTYQSGSVIL